MSDKLIIFDPRDRDIPDGDNQATKRDELRQMICEEMVPIQNVSNPPMSTALFDRLDKMFDDLKMKVRDIEEEFMCRVRAEKTPGVEQVLDFQADPRIQKIEKAFLFFYEHGLLVDAKERSQWFLKYAYNVQKNIKTAQSGHKAEVEKKSKITDALFKGDFQTLVEQLIGLQKQIDVLQAAKKPAKEDAQTVFILREAIKDIIQVLRLERDKFHEFIYTLRKVDCQSQQGVGTQETPQIPKETYSFTEKLLRGNLKP